jgi:hypothetical protein
MGDNAFSYARISDANFPNLITAGSKAFYRGGNVRNAYFPKLEEITASMFYWGSLDGDVDFTSAKKIYGSAFNSCNFKKIIFPSVTEISKGAFGYCSDLVSIDLPSLALVSGGAFEGCNSLKTVILRSEVQCRRNSTDSGSTYDIFYSCAHFTGTVNSSYNPNGDKDGYIYVPRNLIEGYKTLEEWSTYAE